MHSRLILLMLLCMLSRAGAADVDYLRDIQPLLEERCGYCHGPSEQKAGFRVDAGALLHLGGDSGPAVIAGSADQSLLLQAVAGTAKFSRMPLDDDPLTEQEIALLREWITQGARHPENETIVPAEAVTSDHWSFQPIVRPVPPRISDQRARTPIDAFIIDRLQSQQLTLSDEADRATLLRRVSLDLLGLLPAPEEVSEFQNDPAPDAYEKVVDRLLASPHYGERWGRHWLDAARYADSNGFTIDSPREIWMYRDWVIAAINADQPFDQFTIDQLAGDLRDQPTLEQRIATGFHRNTLANEEGGTDDEQFRDESIIDRVNTTATVWLGLTVGCAQCHDHKYDPISQRDYYRLFAILNNTADNNDAGGLAPKISVPSDEQAAELARFEAELKNTRREVQQREMTLAAAYAEWESRLQIQEQQPKWIPLDVAPVSTAGQSFESLPGYAYRVTGDSRPDYDTYRLTLPARPEPIRMIQLETLTHPDLPKTGPGTAGNGNFVLSDVELLAADGAPVALSGASATHSQVDYPISAAIDGDATTGWAINTTSGSMNVPRTAYFTVANPVTNAPLTLLLHHRRLGNKGYLIGSFRVAVSSDGLPLEAINETFKAILATPAEQRTDEQKTELITFQRQQDVQWTQLKAAEKLQRDEIAKLKKSIPTTLVLEELPQARETFIHIRGDFLSKGAKVTPGTPMVLPQPQGIESPTRLDLAHWLVSEEQPLTARVAVNRIWQRFFGIGLVETENDFGLQGSAPSHPELLDWLASELMRQEWSTKALQRTIVLSAVYRQSAMEREALRQADPRNLLLGRQNRIRLEAEIVRDATLAASGLLTPVLYGAPVHPPQPAGIYALTQNSKSWPEEQGANRFRRSVYIRLWRTSPHPLFPTFDAPDSSVTCTRRTRSNTPLQALTLANDRGFVELAQGLAKRVLADGPDDDVARIRLAYEIGFCRSPSDAEAARLQSLLESARGHYATHPEAAIAASGRARSEQYPPAETAAWTALCRVLTNLDEFYTRN